MISNNDYTCLAALVIMFIIQNFGFYYRRFSWFKIKLRYNKIYLFKKLQVQRSEAKLYHSLLMPQNIVKSWLNSMGIFTYTDRPMCNVASEFNNQSKLLFVFWESNTVRDPRRDVYTEFFIKRKWRSGPGSNLGSTCCIAKSQHFVS